MRLLQGHSDAVTCVSLRGRSLVSGGRDRSLVIWEAQPDWRVLRQREYSGEKKFNRKIGVVSINLYSIYVDKFLLFYTQNAFSGSLCVPFDCKIFTPAPRVLRGHEELLHFVAQDEDRCE